MDDHDLWTKALLNIGSANTKKGAYSTFDTLFDVLGIEERQGMFGKLLAQAYTDSFDAETRRKMALLASPFGIALIKKKLRELGKFPPANE